MFSSLFHGIKALNTLTKLQKNLVYVSKFCQSNSVSVEFFDSFFIVKDPLTGAQLARGETEHGVYKFLLSVCPQINVASRVSVSNWHHRFGHLSTKTLAYMLRCNNINVDKKLLDSFHCTACGIQKPKTSIFL